MLYSVGIRTQGSRGMVNVDRSTGSSCLKRTSLFPRIRRPDVRGRSRTPATATSWSQAPSTPRPSQSSRSHRRQPQQRHPRCRSTDTATTSAEGRSFSHSKQKAHIDLWYYLFKVFNYLIYGITFLMHLTI